jgi:hypothetical protein
MKVASILIKTLMGKDFLKALKEHTREILPMELKMAKELSNSRTDSNMLEAIRTMFVTEKA